MASGKGLAVVVAGLLLAGALAGGGDVFAAKTSNVRATKHNLSAAPDGASIPGTSATVPARNAKATTETQVCVFCHTPHGATTGATPLWNRQLSSATYTGYTSKSMDAVDIQASFDGKPDGSSKLCLSCHDGTIAVGAVNVLNGKQTDLDPNSSDIAMTGSALTSGKITADSSGYTRYIGTDLTNDHPISVAYTSALATRDGELRDVGAGQKYPTSATGTDVIVGRRTAADKPKLPLEKTAGDGTTGEIQCASCHDPHLYDDRSEASVGNQKFLRLNRFQEATPSATYDATNDIICLACHDKNIGATGAWAASAHGNPLVKSGATNSGPAYTYNTTAANLRQFPNAQPVWKAACLNCHDTHTAAGARRLLRGGVSGGASAIEETCYQCHTTTASSALETTPAASVPDIESDFSLTYRMPITNSDQSVSAEPHDIGFASGFGAGAAGCSAATGSTDGCGKDFVEAQTLLGNSRHAECTDCHNPHRVMKKQCFNGGTGDSCGASYNLTTPDNEGTHRHTSSTQHTNLASGVLRGAWGVQPKYSGGLSFQTAIQQSDYDVKRGDPPPAASTAVTNTYVTREYQICLKCHSSYAYGATPPLLAGNNANGTTASGTNGLTRYSDQAREFQAPATHADEPLNKGTEAGADNGSGRWNSANHRSWHPVMGPTGRTAAKRHTSASNFLEPWDNNIGGQTMYCTDCHGSNTASQTVVPSGTAPTQKPWGPHGSTNKFLLKGPWADGSSSDTTSVEICMKCHSTIYRSGGGSTGFSGGGSSGGWGGFGGGGGDLHDLHAGQLGGNRCYWCHVVTPHGWKNKQLLVNLNDVGAEAGFSPPQEKATNYTQGPYYYRAYLKVVNFRASGSWDADDCGSTGGQSGGGSGGWGGGGSSTGVNWMQSSCTPSN